MTPKPADLLDPDQLTSQKAKAPDSAPLQPPGDSLREWIGSYQALAVTGVRSPMVADKVALHLDRFRRYFENAYGHDRISACLRRDVLAWQQHLYKEEGLAPATVNNHLASLSSFTTWVHAHGARVFPMGDPAKGVREMALPPLEPRALSEEQIRSLKNLCDRLPRFHQLRSRKLQKEGKEGDVVTRAQGRPWRDRALIFLLLSTGLRREEVVNLDLGQLEPNHPRELCRVHRARITKVQGKGGTERGVFLSRDARMALADYLEKERPGDAKGGATALFLSASCLAARRGDGRLSLRAINHITEQIGRWHDAEVTDRSRQIAPLRPHDLRHTFAFQLAKATGADAYELERRLGHRSQRYIQRYTNPPEAVAAGYIEKL